MRFEVSFNLAAASSDLFFFSASANSVTGLEKVRFVLTYIYDEFELDFTVLLLVLLCLAAKSLF